MSDFTNPSYEDLIPLRSAFTYDDVYRFATNNVIGRKQYQPIVNSRPDAGKCIGALADLVSSFPTSDNGAVTNWFPANYWMIVNKYKMSEAEYFAAVDTIAKDIVAQRAEESEPYEYWYFVVNNCLRVLEAAFVDVEKETVKS